MGLDGIRDGELIPGMRVWSCREMWRGYVRRLSKGIEIIDVGIDPTRNRRSTFYEMEKRIIKEANYPTTPFDRIQAGTRRK